MLIKLFFIAYLLCRDFEYIDDKQITTIHIL